MVLIFAVAALAATAQYVFNRSHRVAPEATATTVKSVRQSLGVLGTLVTGIVALLDAVVAIRKVLPTFTPSQPSGGGGVVHPTKVFGAPAADAVIIG